MINFSVFVRLYTSGIIQGWNYTAYSSKDLHTSKCFIEWDSKKTTSDQDDDTLNSESCVLTVETDDPLITKDSFELMLKRLYGIQDYQKEKEIPAEMISTAFFFQMDDIKDAMSEYWSRNKINMSFVVTALKMVCDHDYGEYGTRLMDRCKKYLYDNGWQAGHIAWTGISPSLIADIVNADEFFVPNEFERIMFAIEVFRNSIAQDYDKDEIVLAITKFRKPFDFFTLTYV
ncbi:unnamed protein product [Ambrosiozyma monospora]|uniref:Unnamed protein product n=1 Tax=Ambrosiozyma monospora TaxID=43982 RepID=A0ACB5T971_AMBMO|nr:unnamed protein product [Ambrosiozyma monospora]